MTDVRSNSIHLLHPKLALFIQSGARLNFQGSHIFANGTLNRDVKWNKNDSWIKDENVGHLFPIIKAFGLIAAL